VNVEFILNGEDVSVKTDPLERLSDLLRERLGIRSLAGDCRAGVCGRCIVLMDGKPANSCLVPAFRARGTEVVTYEGFSSTEDHAILLAAFRELDIQLCGFCDAATLLMAGSLLDRAVRPDDNEIAAAMSSVYCRCAAPGSLLAAVRAAVDLKEGRRYRRAR